MSQEQFSKVLTEFCTLCGISEVGAVLHGSPIEVDGFSCYFEHRDDPVWGRLLVYCDFGPLPETRCDEVCRKLMEANLYLFATQEPTSLVQSIFLVSPDSGHVLFGENFLLNGLTAEQLKDAMNTLTEIARVWHADYFLAPSSSHTGEMVQQALAPALNPYF